MLDRQPDVMVNRVVDVVSPPAVAREQRSAVRQWAPIIMGRGRKRANGRNDQGIERSQIVGRLRGGASARSREGQRAHDDGTHGTSIEHDVRWTNADAAMLRQGAAIGRSNR